MYIDFKKNLSVLAFLAVGIVIGVVGVRLFQRYQAPEQTVSVIGTGEIDVAPDQANINIQIKNTSTTYEKAQAENKKDVDNLKSELTKLGIPESRITISSYSPPIMVQSTDSLAIPEGKMMPSYRRPDTNSTVTTNLTLVLDPIKNIEKVYDAVSKNTNAQITNSYYSLKNRKTWESKAKEEALKDARSQIESVAKINKLRVGKLLSLEDSNNPRPYPVTMKTIINRESPASPNINDQPVSSAQDANVYYSEQSVKITSSFTATYELY